MISSDILNQLNWDQFSVRRSKRICVIMNNIINGTVPDYVSQTFMKSHEINSYRQMFQKQNIVRNIFPIEVKNLELTSK